MWISKEEADILAIHALRAETYMMFYYHPEHTKIREQREDQRKWAIIEVLGKERLAFVHRLTKKAYKVDNYKATWMEIKNFTFVRWARAMDL
jgi:hypothetical protein